MIYLIGGTHDGRQICEWLDKWGLDYFMSVATELGRATYQSVAKRLLVGRLDEDAMTALCQMESVDWVIDASHPHATAVSETAMAVCEKNNTRYTRWIRQEISYDSTQVLLADSFEEAYQLLASTDGKILITGSKELEKTVGILPLERIVARIVPNGESIAICENLGLDAGQVIGIKGPFTDAMNQLIFKEWQIRHIIFKESGSGSGFMEKIHAALACSVNPVVVRLPKLVYPETAGTEEELKHLALR